MKISSLENLENWWKPIFVICEASQPMVLDLDRGNKNIHRFFQNVSIMSPSVTH